MEENARMRISCDKDLRAGIVMSGKVLVGIIAIIGLLLVLTLVGFSSNSNSLGAATATTTLTSTITQQFTKLVYEPGNSSVQGGGANYEQIYAKANPSIVTLAGTQTETSGFGASTATILGSGFVLNYSGTFYIVTNYHVAGSTSNLTVTFSDGDSYAAKVVGSDPYSDLAVVSGQNIPKSEYHSISVVSSSNLQVGQFVVAIGNPFGLSGSMTFGIISQLGRTIQDPTAGNFSIAGAIQFSAPINPGNSGGALLDSNGFVVGITTAVVSGSQGVGFAIPSDTINRELSSLISTGSYKQHSFLGIGGADMNYGLAQASNTNVTYGVLIESLVPGGPSEKAGLHVGTTNAVIDGQEYVVGGDIIVAANGTKIINNDALASYLALDTVPGQTVSFGIIRGGHPMTINVTLGTRPAIG
ncbi:MAG: trypsin-like peptidase domain-containing protein [Thaumarchaeota archaeon]|nr:trypsin-like peptidase domain-containing protein [Nitrososphaerota archaeon]